MSSNGEAHYLMLSLAIKPYKVSAEVQGMAAALLEQFHLNMTTLWKLPRRRYFITIAD